MSWCAVRPKGHCWHEADGQLYQRHAGRDPGFVEGTCCWCGESVQLQMHGPLTIPSIPDPKEKHGPKMPFKDTERMFIVPCPDCEAGSKDKTHQSLSAFRCEKHKLKRDVASSP